MKITDLKLNPKNPRVIKDHKFQELVKSLKDDPEILSVKKLLYDETNNNIILGGNQRFSALLELGYKDIPEKWLEKVGHLSEAQKRKLIVIDNLSVGEWDKVILLEEFTKEELLNYGFEEFELEQSELNIDDFFDKDENQSSNKEDKKIICPNCNHEFTL